MEPRELKALMAASLLGGKIERTSVSHVSHPHPKEIEVAVQTADKIWSEVLRQDA